MKKTVTYPDWVEKYRGKGRTIRKTKNGYALYECTSVYVKGLNYPKSVQKYLGRITENDGFIPKQIPHSNNFIEFGLSHFIISNFKRELLRCTYDNSLDYVVLGIIHFIFDDVNEEFIRSSYITYKDLNHYLSFSNSNISIRRIKTISSRIKKILKDVIPDDNGRNTLVKLLFLSVIDQNDQPESFSPSPVVSNIIERYGLKL